MNIPRSFANNDAGLALHSRKNTRSRKTIDLAVRIMIKHVANAVFASHSFISFSPTAPWQQRHHPRAFP
jgi:hypothetical protein